MLNDSVAA